MTLGLGIFLSSLVVGFVALFITTKDRWNWRRMALKALSGLVILSMVLAVAWYSIYRYVNRPQRETELWSIRLGDTDADVLFKKGVPTSKNEREGSWIYRASGNDGLWALVYFDKNKVQMVQLVGDEANPVPSIQGVSRYSSVEEVTKKFGEPASRSDSVGHTQRILSFPKYNIAFQFFRNYVTGVGVFDGATSHGLQFSEPAWTDLVPTQAEQAKAQ